MMNALSSLNQKILPHESKTSASPCSSLQREVNISDIPELFKKRSHILGSSAKLEKLGNGINTKIKTTI